MNLSFMDADEILRKVLTGAKIFPDEANFLCAEAPLANLAAAARAVAVRANPAGTVGYAVSRTIVYSNVCQTNCPFCQGTVTADDPTAFTRTADEVVAEVAGAVAAGATQIVLQGGHRIDLPWAYYPGLVRAVKARFPQVQVLAYSPSELMVFNVAYQMRSAQVVGGLQEAGMDALLAGGDEILRSRVPEYQMLMRGPWNEWFDVVHRCADAGVPVVVPFVVGIGESVRERVGHLMRVRAVQERTATAGRPAFRALIVFTLGEAGPAITGHQYLRMVALARVLVPNIPHVQASIASRGTEVALAALDGGADELSSIRPEVAADLEGRIRRSGRGSGSGL